MLGLETRPMCSSSSNDEPGVPDVHHSPFPLAPRKRWRSNYPEAASVLLGFRPERIEPVRTGRAIVREKGDISIQQIADVCRVATGPNLFVLGSDNSVYPTLKPSANLQAVPGVNASRSLSRRRPQLSYSYESKILQPD